MNLTPFLNSFPVTHDIGNAPFDKELLDLKVDEDFATVINTLGGKTFRDGLYRVLRGDQVIQARNTLIQVFPEYTSRIVPFAYDWAGRYFAVDFERSENKRPQILMLEEGAGEAFQIPVTIIDFHNDELLKYEDDALGVPFYKQWKKLNPAPIPPDKCVGYRKPLFLGGKDTLENLELSDLSVYLEMCAQFRELTRGLPEGTRIGGISIQD